MDRMCTLAKLNHERRQVSRDGATQGVWSALPARTSIPTEPSQAPQGTRNAAVGSRPAAALRQPLVAVASRAAVGSEGVGSSKGSGVRLGNSATLPDRRTTWAKMGVVALRDLGLDAVPPECFEGLPDSVRGADLSQVFGAVWGAWGGMLVGGLALLAGLELIGIACWMGARQTTSVCREHN
jgi:hypothetical protein